MTYIGYIVWAIWYGPYVGYRESHFIRFGFYFFLGKMGRSAYQKLVIGTLWAAGKILFGSSTNLCKFLFTTDSIISEVRFFWPSQNMKILSSYFRENQLVKCSCLKSLQKYGLMMQIKLPDDIAAHDSKKTKKWFCTSKTDKIHIQESAFSILNNRLKSHDQLTRFHLTLRILDHFFIFVLRLSMAYFSFKRGFT